MYRNVSRNLLAAPIVALLLTTTACGAQSGQQEPPPGEPEKSAVKEETTAMERGAKKTGVERKLAQAEIGKDEITNMTPADGKEPDDPQPLPENAPEGLKLYPAATNETVDGRIDYRRTPPTNGDHAPLWQNCGYYSEPIDARTAVHSMDHGVVWISYNPNLPQSQIEELRSYAEKDYTIVAPYPNLPAPVVATAWRLQLELDGADDPRLRQFVDDFKNSEIAPLSGNRCVGGAGEPES